MNYGDYRNQFHFHSSKETSWHFLPFCNMLECQKNIVPIIRKDSKADISGVAHSPTSKFYSYSTCFLHAIYKLPHLNKIKNKIKNSTTSTTRRQVTWLLGAILIALHTLSVNGKQYHLMFMPYVLSFLTY